MCIRDSSKTLSEDQVYNCILQNYEALGTDWITHQWNWINGIYTSFQDHIKFLIIISLVEKTLNFYHQVNITQNYDQYYAKDNLKIDVVKFNPKKWDGAISLERNKPKYTFCLYK